MSHIGLLCPPTPGHLNPMSTLGRALQRRGHRVTMFQLADLRERSEREGLEFAPLGEGLVKPGELGDALEQLGRLAGFRALRFTIRWAGHLARVVLDTAPAALSAAKVDLAIIDQNEPAGASVASHLKLPFVNVAHIPLNREANMPPPFVPWPFSESALARLRNRMGYRIADALLTPLTSAVNRRRREWGLPWLKGPDDSFSPLAQLCTLPEELDFPRSELPSCLHYLGPFIDASRTCVPFPWDKLDGRPLVYASFGTLQNRRQEQFSAVADACAELDVQLVLSAGGGEIVTEGLKGSPIVVPYAPQLELLPRASVVVTHAGLNTVLEALYFGVPMIAIPVTNDQPAVAARLARYGAGKVVNLNQLAGGHLRQAIAQVLSDGEYRRRAQEMKGAIARAGGVERAADIVEQQLPQQRPADLRVAGSA